MWISLQKRNYMNSLLTWNEGVNWGKQSKLYIYIQNEILQGNPYHVNDDLNRKMHQEKVNGL